LTFQTLSLKIKINSRLTHKNTYFCIKIKQNDALNIKKIGINKVKVDIHIGSLVIKGILELKWKFWEII